MRKVALSFSLLALFSLSHTAAQTPSRRAKSKPKAPVVKPFSVERIIVRLQDVNSKEYTEAALIKKIEKDGIDFTATPQNLLRLTNAGATVLLLDLVKRLAPAPLATPPPAVVKPHPTGALEITCFPSECRITLDGKQETASTNGKLRLQNLEPGNVSVQAAKDGFVSWTGSVKIVASEKAEVIADLKPSLETQQVWGLQLKDQMLQDLGIGEDSGKARSHLLLGDATIWGHDGRKYTSSLEVFLHMPNKAFFRTRAGKRSTFEVEFLPPFRSKSNLTEGEARDTEAGLRLFLKYRISELVNRLNSPGVQLLGQTGTAADGVELRCKSSTDEFLIVLDGNGRPKEVSEEQPFGSGVRALYSAYRPLGTEYIPSEISIVWPGSPKQGIAVQFQSFEQDPDPRRESGYRLKRSRFF